MLTGIREEYDATGDNAESVARGMAGTGRVITSAGLIMTMVFLSFVANPSPLARMLGVGLATAVALDATIVRMLVVPATMTLLGRANWWLPRSLDRWLPRMVPERAGGPGRPEQVPAGRVESTVTQLPDLHRPQLPDDLVPTTTEPVGDVASADAGKLPAAR